MRGFCRQVLLVFRREFAGFFRTPGGFVVLVAFLAAAVGFPWFVGNFLERDDASLSAFFHYLPWVLGVFVPAVCMRFWADELRSGSIEVLLTLPLSRSALVAGKFLAGWAYVSLAILLTFPLALTVEYLGAPDWGPIVSGYLGAILVSGVLAALTCMASAATRSAVVAFVGSFLPAVVLLLAGYSRFNELMADAGLPVVVIDAVAGYGLTTHFTPMTRGLVGTADLVWFAALILLFLLMNRILLSPRRAGVKLLAAGLLAIPAVVLIPFAGGLPGRADFTAGQLFTLTAESRAVAAAIEEPVELDFYFSRGSEVLPIVIKNYATRVEEVLRAYESASGGRIRVRVVDPEPDSPEELEGVRAGLDRRSLNRIDHLLFGLVARQGEQSRVIPFFHPDGEAFLEYSISSLLLQLGEKPQLPVIGIYSRLRLEGRELPTGQRRTGLAERLVAELRARAEVRILANLEDLGGLDLLMVLHPGRLEPEDLYSLDQYVLSGGPLFLALDGSHFAERVEARSRSLVEGPPSSTIERLPGVWGLAWDPEQVIGDPLNASEILDPGTGLATEYPVWIELSGLEPQSPMMAGVSDLRFVEAGSLRIDGTVPGWTPLVETSEVAGEVMTASLNVVAPRNLGDQLGLVREPRLLAASFTGELVSAYPDGAPGPEGEDPFAAMIREVSAGGQEKLVQSAEPARIVVVADVDFLLDEFALREARFGSGSGYLPANDNLAFALNAVDVLLGRPELVAMRGKGSATRRFTLIKELEAVATAQWKQPLSRVAARLTELQSRILALGESEGAGAEIGEEMRELQVAEAEARAEQRRIIRNLRESVDRLEVYLALLNFALVPAILLGIGTLVLSRRKGLFS